MKIRIEFDGLDPDEAEQFEIMQNARNFMMVIHAVRGYIRGEIKCKELSDEVYEAVEKVNQVLWDAIVDEGVERHF